MGLFLNSHSPTVAEQLAHSGYDWLLVDSQHGPMGYEKLSAMLSGISNGERQVAGGSGWQDMATARAFSSRSIWARTAYSRALHQHCRGGAASGELLPVSDDLGRARFTSRSAAPTKAACWAMPGAWNSNAIVALQVETASCIENIEEIAAVPRVDILFLGQNDLCMSMGLYNKYEFPHMYTSPELGAATNKLVEERSQEPRDPRTVSVWDFAGWGVLGEGVHVHQRRQRSASCSDAGRGICWRHGEDCSRRQKKELEAQGDGAVLGTDQLDSLERRAASQPGRPRKTMVYPTRTRDGHLEFDLVAIGVVRSRRRSGQPIGVFTLGVDCGCRRLCIGEEQASRSSTMCQLIMKPAWLGGEVVRRRWERCSRP